MMTTSDPAATDAVTMLRRLHARAVASENHGDVPRVSSDEVLAVLRTVQAEREELERELTARRVLDADVRACAEYVVVNSAPAAALSKEHQVFRETASRILAALDYHECPKCARSPATEALFAVSCEAEELRSGLEKLMADGDPSGADIVSRDSLQALLDKVDARDSLLTLETIDSLRDQLRKVEGERDDLKRHYEEALECETESFREQLRPLEALRALLPDVRACAEYCRNILIGPPGMPVEDYPLAPVALAARRILAALDSQGGEGGEGG